MVIYIGLRDVVGDDQLSSHKWEVDGSMLTYSNFDNNEPDQGFKQCIALAMPAGGKWQDRDCNVILMALCEAKPVSESVLFFTISHRKIC